MFAHLSSIFRDFMIGSDPVLREIAQATGHAERNLRGLDSRELLDVIARAGIPMGDIPPHIVEALGLIPLRERG
ncbi:hypothetical protein [Pontivivens insulae]|uniref:Uncharacterized protein n=1 Tax=Pontivivens insulae TaxID=1639689 RepID=A0A2R8ADX8_9RHOB|nr:hypothetical protein [Pontivivens insulae]RED14380.1 hypothetical protein DFR53_1739 [Pontivivens insulae]SPF30457.1 hypothetical protein POI8812_02795 [Pontivivens insulae]